MPRRRPRSRTRCSSRGSAATPSGCSCCSHSSSGSALWCSASAPAARGSATSSATRAGGAPGSPSPTPKRRRRTTRRAPQAWRDLSTAYQTEGDTADAIDALNRAIVIRPKSPEAYRELAGLHLTRASEFQQQLQQAQVTAAFRAPGTAFPSAYDEVRAGDADGPAPERRQLGRDGQRLGALPAGRGRGQSPRSTRTRSSCGSSRTTPTSSSSSRRRLSRRGTSPPRSPRTRGSSSWRPTTRTRASSAHSCSSCARTRRDRLAPRGALAVNLSASAPRARRRAARPLARRCARARRLRRHRRLHRRVVGRQDPRQGALQAGLRQLPHPRGRRHDGDDRAQPRLRVPPVAEGRARRGHDPPGRTRPDGVRGHDAVDGRTGDAARHLHGPGRGRRRHVRRLGGRARCERSDHQPGESAEAVPARRRGGREDGLRDGRLHRLPHA